MPPIQGIDWNLWQTFLGDQALPYGLNTFPIFAVGPAEDYVLAVSDFNCPLFMQAWNQVVQQTEENWYVAALLGPPELRPLINTYSFAVLCDYANWAYTSWYELNEWRDEMAYIQFKICPGYYTDLNEGMQQIDASNSYIVSTGYMQVLINEMSTGTFAFSNMQTVDGYHLYTIASATSSSTLLTEEVVPASTLSFEVYSDNTLKAFYVENQFTPIGCVSMQNCTVDEFVSALVQKVTRPDFVAHCEEAPNQ